MSGGRFDYKDSWLRSDLFGYGSRPVDIFEDAEISELVNDALLLIHDLDLYLSGDTCEDTYIKSKRVFKDKWFVNHDKTLKQIVDYQIDQLRADLHKMLLDYDGR